jgi:hypothetical protein
MIPLDSETQENSDCIQKIIDNKQQALTSMIAQIEIRDRVIDESWKLLSENRIENSVNTSGMVALDNMCIYDVSISRKKSNGSLSQTNRFRSKRISLEYAKGYGNAINTNSSIDRFDRGNHRLERKERLEKIERLAENTQALQSIHTRNISQQNVSLETGTRNKSPKPRSPRSKKPELS